MATNGSAHRLNKNDNNWLHKPQHVNVFMSSNSMVYLDSPSAFAHTDQDFKDAIHRNVHSQCHLLFW